MRCVAVLAFPVCLWLAAGVVRAEAWEDMAPEPNLASRAVRSSRSSRTRLKLIPGSQIVAELKQAGQFQPAGGFYAGHMGKVYDAAMAVVSRPQHYMKLREDEVYLDPTTEAHESLHAMSSLIRNVRGWSISKGYDVIYVGSGQFAEIRVATNRSKGQLRGWLPSSLQESEIARTHLEDPVYRNGHVVLVVEELAYHLLDAKIGLENHLYMEQKLGNRNAVSVPAAEWSALALAAASMLDADSQAFRRSLDRDEFNVLVGRLVDEAATVYAKGMNRRRYGLLANLAPESREHFSLLLTDDSKQAGWIRDFCARTFGKSWLPGLIARVDDAREATKPTNFPGIDYP